MRKGKGDMTDSKGAAHILAVFLIVLVCLIALNFLLKDGKTGSPQAVDSRDRDSVEFVRQSAYAVIDVHSGLMKMQVDMAIKAWDSMTPEQKQRIREYILKILESEMNRGQSLFGQFSKEELQEFSPSQLSQHLIGGR